MIVKIAEISVGLLRGLGKTLKVVIGLPVHIVRDSRKMREELRDQKPAT